MNHESIIETATTEVTCNSQISLVASQDWPVPAQDQRTFAVDKSLSFASLPRFEFHQGNQISHCDHDSRTVAMCNLHKACQRDSRILPRLWGLLDERLGQDVSPPKAVGFAILMAFLVRWLGWKRSKAKVSTEDSKPKAERQGQRKRKRKSQGRYGGSPFLCWTIFAILAVTTGLACDDSECGAILTNRHQPISASQEASVIKRGTGTSDTADVGKDTEVAKWAWRGSYEGSACLGRSHAEGNYKELSGFDHSPWKCAQDAQRFGSGMGGLSVAMGQLHGHGFTDVDRASRILRTRRICLHDQAERSNRKDPRPALQVEYNSSKDDEIRTRSRSRTDRSRGGDGPDRRRGRSRHDWGRCSVGSLENPDDECSSRSQGLHRSPCQTPGPTEIQIPEEERWQGRRGSPDCGTKFQIAKDDTGGCLAPILLASKEVASSSFELKQRGAERTFKCLGWTPFVEAVSHDGFLCREALQLEDPQALVSVATPKTKSDLLEWQRQIHNYQDYKSSWRARLEAIWLETSICSTSVHTEFSVFTQGWVVTADPWVGTMHGVVQSNDNSRMTDCCESPHVSDLWCAVYDRTSGINKSLTATTGDNEQEVNIDAPSPPIGDHSSAHRPSQLQRPLGHEFASTTTDEEIDAAVAKQLNVKGSLHVHTYGYKNGYVGLRRITLSAEDMHQWRDHIRNLWSDHYRTPPFSIFSIRPPPTTARNTVSVIVQMDTVPAGEVLVLTQLVFETAGPAEPTVISVPYFTSKSMIYDILRIEPRLQQTAVLRQGFLAWLTGFPQHVHNGDFLTRFWISLMMLPVFHKLW